MKYTDEYKDDIRRILKNIPNVEGLKNKTVLITGCTGMLCSPVADVLFYLNEEQDYGINVILAARNKERTENRFTGKTFKFVSYDATSSEPMRTDDKIDFIIHGASNADPSAFTREPVETMLANTVGLKVLLDLARDNNARILYVSSSEVYGRKDNNEPFPEDHYGYVDILNPRACYPNSKRMAETMCIAYSEEYGIDPVIVRPGHIYGPTITASDSRATAQFTRKAAAGENIIMKSAGTQLRSYTYTLDCASALLCVLLNGEKNSAYNISNPDSVCSIRQIAEALAEAGNVEVVFEMASETEKKGYNLMDNSSLQAQRLLDLGWSAEFSLAEGAARTLRQYQ